MQVDPALKELVYRHTGQPSLDRVEGPARELVTGVVARLRDPARPVAGLQVVARCGAIVTGRVRLGRLADVRRNENVLSLKAARELRHELHTSIPEIGLFAREAVSGHGGAGVVVAALDWGCDFVHANFRDVNGRTRLLAIWDQRASSGVDSPAPFGYGREHSAEKIDAALAAGDPYLALGYDPTTGGRDSESTHGTHVLDIMAGNGRAPGAAAGVAPHADLLFVHLKGDDTDPTGTLGDSVRLLEALRYAVDRAGDRPVVIGISLGLHGGPHDGTTLVEQGMDALLAEKPGRAIAMSTGNYFSARIHAAATVAQAGFVDLHLELPGREHGVTEVEVWYPGSDRLSAELVGPDGVPRVRAALGEDAIIGAEVPEVTLYHRAHDPNNQDHQLDVFFHPAARAGTWTLRLHGEHVVAGTLHAWIERDDPLTQARFAVDSAVASTTTNTICNGRHTIAVGAYDARAPARPLLPFSSAGPTRDGRAKPELVAPGGAIQAAGSSRWREGTRTRDDLVVKSGTSMAAPHVAGVLALMFEAAGERRLTIEETRRLLLGAARPVPIEPDSAGRSGAGRLDAAAAVTAVEDAIAAGGAPIAVTAAPPRLPSVDQALQALGLTRGRSREERREVRPESMTVPSRHKPASLEVTMESEMDEASPEGSVLEWLRGWKPQEGSENEQAEACLEWLRGPPPGPRLQPTGRLAEAVEVVRKNAFELSGRDIDAIVDALTKMSRTTAWWEFVGAHVRVIDGSAASHGMFAGTADAYHRFLPWHRLFLWDFELKMRAHNARAFIPYWDWSIADQRHLPDWITRVPSSLMRAGAAPFAVERRDPSTSTRANLPTRAEIHDLMRRDRGRDPRTGAWVATTTYDAFTAALELLHGAPHVWIGGTMNSAESPADFMFFLHHAQIDRLWRTWQTRFPGQRPSLTGSAAQLLRVGRPPLHFGAVLDAPGLGFDYDRPWS